MKKFFISMFAILILPVFVKAGTIEFTNPKQTSSNTYEFVLKVDNIKLNSIEGDFHITNGTVTNIEMNSSWMNQTGINHHFYFYRDGASTGSYTVATIEVTMTDNSVYSIHNLEYVFHQCKSAKGLYFGENGNLVSKSVYDSTCGLSKDATLKSITPNYGKLSPSFDSALSIYGMTVENNVSEVEFNPVTTNLKAKVISGKTCSLHVGVNQCQIVVQAEAGNQKTYTISVARKNAYNSILSSDASISNLEVHGGQLTEDFNPKRKEYDVKVSTNASSIYFTFITNSDKAFHKSDSCNVTEGTKTCTLTITAEDGITKDNYVFTILRETKENQSTSNSTIGSNTKNDSNKSNNSSTNTNKKEENPNSNVSTSEKNEISSNETIETNSPNLEEQNSREKNKEDSNEKEVKKERKKFVSFVIFSIFDFILGIGIGAFVVQKLKIRNNKKKKGKKKK